MTFQQWVESLMAYDLILGSPHKYTGESMHHLDERWSLWREAIAAVETGTRGRALFDVLFEQWSKRHQATPPK